MLGVINPAIAMILGIGALVLWRRDRTQTHLLGFAAAAGAMALSFTLNHYAGDWSPVVVRTSVSVLSLVGCVVTAWAACRRMKCDVPVKAWTAGAALTITLMLLSDPAADILPWILGLNIYCGIIFFSAAQLIAGEKSAETVDRVMVWVFLLIGAQFILRPVLVVMIEGPMTSAEYRGSVGHALYVVSGAIFMLLLAASVIAATVADQMRIIRDSTRKDLLSGLAVRSAFEADAVQMLTRAEDEGVPVCLIVADIDHFKRVNDFWGHPAGDRVINNFGDVFRRTIRPSDIAGRVGGEEFCVMVWDCPEDAAAKLAERLRRQFARERHEGIGKDISLTASFGVSLCEPGERYEVAYERADCALYQAKRSGRNRVVSEAGGLVGNPETANEQKPKTKSDEIANLPPRRNANRP